MRATPPQYRYWKTQVNAALLLELRNMLLEMLVASRLALITSKPLNPAFARQGTVGPEGLNGKG